MVLKYLNIKTETHKLLEDEIGKTQSPRHWQGISEQNSTQEITSRINTWDCDTQLLHSKPNKHQSEETQPTGWGKCQLHNVSEVNQIYTLKYYSIILNIFAYMN